jgi:hypothetical protein
MTLHDLRSDTFFERHAWKVFTGLSLIVVLFGVGDQVLGVASSQEDAKCSQPPDR